MATADMAGRLSRRAALRLGGGTGLLAAVGAAAGRGGAGHAHAQTPPQVSTPRPTITLAAAQALIAAAQVKALEIGVPMAMAVVTDSGVLKAFGAMDGSSPVSVDIVQAKAYTAVAFRAPTHLFAQGVQANPALLASLSNLPRVILLGGGYPVMQGGAVVGGLGVGGGSTEQDMQVAEAALAALS